VDRVFVVGQMAMTIVLLASAGMLIQSLWNLQRVETGFDTENLLLLEINSGVQEAAEADPLYARVRSRVESVPGVRLASFLGKPLLTGESSQTGVSADGAERQIMFYNWVGAGFFETLGIPVLAGRDIEESDYQESQNVVVISESAARLLYGGQAALGRPLSSPLMGELEIIGIVRDTRYESLRGEMPPTIFAPYTQFPRRAVMTLVVRTVGDPLGLVPAIQTAVREVAPEVPVTEVSTQASEIEDLLAQERLLGRFLGIFGGMALFLAAIGIYGVTANTVLRRVREIGVRIAVGAGSGDIFRMVLGNVARLVFVGLVLGVPAAVAASRLVRAQLFGLEPGDPWSLGAAAGLMLLVALGAGFVPARRAARIAPLEAIRRE
jgi:predicted permease